MKILSIREPDHKIIKELIQLEEQAFGSGGLHNEWLLVPMIRHGRVYGISDDNKLIGSAQLMRDWSNSLVIYLYGINIAPAYQGKGYGGILMGAVLDELARERWQKIQLTVDPQNKPAIHLYTNKYGFKEKSLMENEYGVGEHRLVMEKILNE